MERLPRKRIRYLTDIHKWTKVMWSDHGERIFFFFWGGWGLLSLFVILMFSLLTLYISSLCFQCGSCGESNQIQQLIHECTLFHLIKLNSKLARELILALGDVTVINFKEKNTDKKYLSLVSTFLFLDRYFGCGSWHCFFPLNLFQWIVFVLITFGS